MNLHRWVVAAWFALTSTAWAQSDFASAPVQEPVAPVEEVLVSGEQPGPGLWRVSHGDHSLWLLGLHSPLPAKMSWKSSEVERLIAQSQLVLIYDGASLRPDIGFFRGMLLLPSVLGAAKNPDGAKLQ